MSPAPPMSLAVAVFETLELRNGKPFALSRHLQRLSDAAAKLQLGSIESAPVRTAIQDLCAEWGSAPGRLRVTWSNKLTLAASAMTVQRSPIAVSSSAYRLDPASLTAGLKTSWYSTNSALLAAHPETAEVLFANLQGQLCSAAMSNVFVVLDGILHTPPLDSGCRAGVTRELLLEALADAGHPAKQTPIAFSELQRAEELFLVSTARQIQPAHQLDQRELPAPRPLTEFAQACFDDRYRLLIDP